MLCKASKLACLALLACLLLTVRADDSEEDNGESEEDEDVSQPAQKNCIRYCRGSRQLRVCGTNGKTFWSQCHLRRYACNTGLNVVVAYAGPCRLQPKPRTTARPVTRRPPPATTRRTTRAPPTTRPPRVTTMPPQTNLPATIRPVNTNPPATEPPAKTTTPLPCPNTCDLVLDPVCTTVGTYQSECAFNSVRCRNIISQEEMILYRGHCMTSTTAGP